MNVLIISALLGVVLLFSGVLVKQTRIVRALAILGMASLFVINVLEISGVSLFNVDTHGMMRFDRFALLFNAVMLFSTLVYFVLSARDMEKVGIHYGEYFALIFFIICGIVLVASFKSLLVLFLGIEIISIPLYILTGSDKKNLKSNEASLKYFLMGAFSTGLMLMGIALIYGATGTFNASDMIFAADKPAAMPVAGMLLLLFSMAFKVSAAPFHFWTPDVYDGAPTVFTSFMATIVKAAVFIGFIRLFDEAFGSFSAQWQTWIAIITVVTLFIGNITAVFQQSVKRMLAYSSIAQAGFMLLAIYAMNADAKEGILLYAAAYCLATIGIFAVLAKMTDYTFEGFNGMARQQPMIALLTTIFFLSLAGIPLTAGFLAKFYMLKAALSSGGSLWVVIFAVLMAAVSVWYYFRVIQAMYFKEGQATIQASPVFKWTLAVLAAAVVLLGLFPNLLLYWYYF